MTLSPLYSASHVFHPTSTATGSIGSHKVQLFLDYNCRYSSKLFLKFYDEVIPMLEKKHPGKFEFILMHIAQPWHPTGSLEHEVALAVAKVQPESFWKYSEILFLKQTQFFDEASYDKTRSQIYRELINIAADNFDIDDEELWKLVGVPSAEGEATNIGNKIAKDFKYFLRYHRTVGVHITPTVFVDGIINSTIESSNSSEQIAEFLERYL